MHTHQSADDVQIIEPFSMEVQMMDRWAPEDEGAVGAETVTVYALSDPEWVVPARLGNFGDYNARLTRYFREVVVETRPGVVVWEDPRRAVPTIPITDIHYPTVCLIALLRSAGWYSKEGTVTHTSLLAPGTTAPYDGREAMKQKYYYMCLLRLSFCLPLAGGSLPSQEPIAFYKLLLRGEKATPGGSSRFYILCSSTRRRACSAKRLFHYTAQSLSGARAEAGCEPPAAGRPGRLLLALGDGRGRGPGLAAQ